MKKSAITLICILSVLLPCAAFSETFDELLEEKQLLCQALWTAEEWSEVLLPIGAYEIGVDIPAGEWTFYAYDYSRPRIHYGRELMPGGARMHEGNVAEWAETVKSPKFDHFDSRTDKSYFTAKLKSRRYIVVKYGMTWISKEDDKPIQFAGNADNPYTEMNGEEIRKRIDEISELLKASPEYNEIIVETGVWKIGEDIPAGKYEIRPLEGEKTGIEYGTRVAEDGLQLDKARSIWATLVDEKNTSYDKTEDLSVDYWTMEEGDFFAVVREGKPAVLTTYIGREPFVFR